MTQDSIRIMCPNISCRRVLAVPENARGKTVRCRGCGTNIRIPAKPPVAPAATVASESNESDEAVKSDD